MGFIGRSAFMVTLVDCGMGHALTPHYKRVTTPPCSTPTNFFCPHARYVLRSVGVRCVVVEDVRLVSR